MEKLEPRQKQEWKCFNDHWIRTGCHNLWDAVFIAFRDYRDASPQEQRNQIQEKTELEFSPNEEWIMSFYKKLQSEYSIKEEEDEIRSKFFYLLPLKLIISEILPYLLKYIENNVDIGMDPFYEEILDKFILLAKYRQKKKNLEDEHLEEQLRDYLMKLCKQIQLFSYDEVRQGMKNLEHQLIIISTDEKVLFDSKTLDDDDGIYQDVIILLAHPDGSYDSIGRLSHTKDGHQKISRLFHYDDHVVESLRSEQKQNNCQEL